MYNTNITHGKLKISRYCDTNMMNSHAHKYNRHNQKVMPKTSKDNLTHNCLFLYSRYFKCKKDYSSMPVIDVFDILFLVFPLVL